MKSVIKNLLLGITLALGVVLVVLAILKGSNKSEVVELQKVIQPTVTIQYEGMGGGSGTCIFKEEIDGKVEMYFLTANHVVDFSMYKRYSRINGASPYQPIHPLCENEATQALPPPLFVKGWLPHKGELEEVFNYTATIYKAWPEIDTAIVKIVEDSDCLLNIGKIPCAKIESEEVFISLKPGHPVVCSGCPYLLPCLVSKGHIGRHNYIGGNMPPDFPDHFCLVRVNIAGGASGGGIYNCDNMKIIGIVSIGWGNNAFICGMIPISDILPKLRKTYIGQRIGL